MFSREVMLGMIRQCKTGDQMLETIDSILNAESSQEDDNYDPLEDFNYVGARCHYLSDENRTFSIVYSDGC